MKAWVYRSFTRGKVGGNLAGVVGCHLTEDKMRGLAAELGFSETVFIGREEEPRLRFFTPTEEVDLCGHALVAALKWLDESGPFPPAVQTKAGRIVVTKEGEAYFMRQPQLQRCEVLTVGELAPLFDLPLSAYDPEHPPLYASTGLKDLFVAVKTEADLWRASPDLQAICRISEKYQAVGVHLYTVTDTGATVRNFAPLYGIDEESATGTSNGALGALLEHWGQGSGEQHMLQGDGMDAPSTIRVRMDQTDHPLVGGTVVCETLLEGDWDL